MERGRTGRMEGFLWKKGIWVVKEKRKVGKKVE